MRMSYAVVSVSCHVSIVHSCDIDAMCWYAALTVLVGMVGAGFLYVCLCAVVVQVFVCFCLVMTHEVNGSLCS